MRATRDFSAVAATVTYGAGRICASRGCDTRLSTYNPTTFCGLHAGRDDSPPAGFKCCKRCERVLPEDAFPLKRKTHGETVYHWRLRTCGQCVSVREREARERDRILARGRSRSAAMERQRQRDRYYQKTYGYPTREAYRAACARGEA